MPGANDPDTRWPTDGDRLFLPEHPAFDAYITCNPAERGYRLPRGYKRAGDLLLKQAGQNAADRLNVLYAALFCYRQSIELFLKCLVDKFGRSANRRNNIHDLDELWRRFMGVVRDRESENSAGIRAAEALVMEMHSADQKSDGFRFPTDTTGAPFVFLDRHFDLSNLQDVMTGLANFFECADLQFSHEDRVF